MTENVDGTNENNTENSNNEQQSEKMTEQEKKNMFVIIFVSIFIFIGVGIFLTQALKKGDHRASQVIEDVNDEGYLDSLFTR